MTVLDRIDEHLTENFAKGKDAEYLSGWLVGMFNKRVKSIEAFSKVGNYGQLNNVVNATINDLNMIKNQLNYIAKTGKTREKPNKYSYKK
jgi:hypothetical protein